MVDYCIQVNLWSQIAKSFIIEYTMKLHSILKRTLLSLLVLGQLSVFSQEYQLTASPKTGFTEVTSAILTGLYNSGSAEWGDYNNDGYLDILMTGVDGTGNRASKIFRNNGDETFTDVTASLLAVAAGTAVWVDYNNDGFLDIFYSGSGNSEQVSKLLKNNGDGTFSENTNLALVGVQFGSAAFADYNNDGYLDFIYTGQVYYDIISKVYKNNGDETFSEQTSISIPGVLYSSVDWGDFDNDGFIDIVMNGNFNGPWYTKIYRNNGNGNFTEVINTNIVGVAGSSCEWGDYDNDGFLDILVCGWSSDYNSHAKVYKNNGNGTFALQTGISLLGIYSGHGSWGDYNNDGFLDILLTGSSFEGKIAKIYSNNGVGGFSEALGISLPGVNEGEAKWGDYDNDGDLDILLTGETGSGERIAKIFRNEGAIANQTPSKPTNLQAIAVGKTVALSWDVTTDAETPSMGLSYNIYVGTATDNFQIATPHADTTSGLRSIAKRGLIQTNSITLKNLNGGTYYWSVQAIDKSFSGSEFAEQSSFSVLHYNSIEPFAEQNLIIGELGTPLTVTESLIPDSRQWKYGFAEEGPFDQEITGATLETYSPQFNEGGSYYVVCVSKFGEIEVVSNCVKINVHTFSEQVNDPAFPNVHSGSTAWGDYNNDGLLDLLFTGLPGDAQNNAEAISQVYKNNGDGTFSLQSTIELIGVYKSSVDWGDYDNDGLLDILLTGTTENFYTGAISKVYRNNGDNTFTEQTGISLPGVHNGTARWVDFDNNGTLDILLAGQSTNGNSVFTVYKNTNNGFTQHPTNLIPFSNGKFDLGDFNNDGFTDILMSGLDYSGNKLTTIYKNNGDETFTRLSTLNLTSLNLSSVAWGDYNNDGFLDILLSGTPDGWTATTKIFKNNGNETFTEQASISLLGVNMGSVTWGDYNNDGFSDIIINGTIRSACAGGFTKVYKNTGTGSFVEATDVPLPGLTYASSAWGDYDADGDLDLFISGETTSQFTYYSKLYRNNCVQPNQHPTAPVNLNSQIVGGKAFLSWSRATDTETHASALSYNLHIARAADNSLVKNPMSDLETGYRKVVGQGNAGNDTAYIAIGLATGSYVWRAQTIDNAFAASSFSEWNNFEILPQFTEKQFLAGYEHANINWIDYDNDGNLDIYLTGYDGHNGSISKVFKNQGNTSYNFTEQNQISLPGVVAGINSVSNGEDGFRINKNGATSWADYNNDGFLDLLIAGSLSNSDNSPENALTKIFSNNGDGSFTELTSASLPQFAYGPSVAWCDFDNDGHQDIFITGIRYQQFGGYGTTAIFRNNGDSTFTEQTNIWLESATSGSVDIGDYDNDGYPDLIITGSDRAKLYRNNGDWGFDLVANTPFVPVKHSSVAWGDYNNDGFLDVLLTGMDVNNNRISKIYRNNGNGTFTDINVFMQGMSGGVVSWGDYDNDGDLDILMTGASSNNTNAIFENNGDGTFTEKDFGFDKLVNGYSAFGDFDNDGDLDVVSSGKAMLSNNSYTTRTKIYQNNGNYANHKPTPPQNLSIERVGEKYRFSWETGSDDKTPSSSLSYNLRIGTISGGRDVLSPLGFVNTSQLLYPQMGNCQLSRSKTVKSLQPGTYYWSVQAVDQTYKAGEWAAEQVLVVSPIIADFSATTVCQGMETEFTDISISTFEPILSWSWLFGNGETSNVQTPSHIFQSAGSHNVILTIHSASYESTINKTIFVKPKPVANFNAPAVCIGSTTPFSNISTIPSGLSATWNWTFDDNQTSTDEEPEHGYLNTGNYNVKLRAIASNQCSDSITKIVVVAGKPNPVLILDYGDPSFCIGDSVQYSVQYNSNYNYQWQRNNNNIAETANTLKVKSISGNYKVIVTNTLANNCAETSETKTIVANSSPTKPIISEANNNTLFCFGTEVELLVTNEVPELNYQWKRSGINIAGATSPSYAGKLVAGDYKVEVSSGGCANESDILTLTTKPAPAKPTLNARGPNVWILGCSNIAATDYRWFYNNQLIVGAKAHQYVANRNYGDYYVEINEGSECYSASNVVNIAAPSPNFSASYITNSEVAAYPNPTDGSTYISFEKLQLEKIEVEILDALGKPFANFEFENTSGFTVDLSDKPSGVYYCRIKYLDSLVVKKIVKL
jgi:PKD repeat protein